MLKSLLTLVLTYVLKRLKEPSTWTGLALGATAVGVQVSPELQDSITKDRPDGQARPAA